MKPRPLPATGAAAGGIEAGVDVGPPTISDHRSNIVLAVLRRIRPGHAAWALGFVLAIHVVGTFGNRNKSFLAPATFLKSGLLIEVLSVLLAMLAVFVADECVSRGARRWPTYLVSLTTGLALAAGWQWELRAWLGWQTLLSNQARAVVITQPAYLFLQMLLWAGLVCVIVVKRRSARQAQSRLHAAALARVTAARRTLESRLQAMQARVEPQFQFNTLAQVRELYESDAGAAKRMLSDLIDYLRAAWPHMRESSSTVGQELELARAYMSIMKVRLGARLQVEFDVQPGVAHARLPPMMLLPLIDHALVYGLQPGVDSGSIRISTRLTIQDSTQNTSDASKGRLQLTIVDSGAGFVPDAGAGAGLLSVGERLLALYGDQARFVLERLNGPDAGPTLHGGTRAVLEIPYENTQPQP